MWPLQIVIDCHLFCHPVGPMVSYFELWLFFKVKLCPSTVVLILKTIFFIKLIIERISLYKIYQYCCCFWRAQSCRLTSLTPGLWALGVSIIAGAADHTQQPLIETINVIKCCCSVWFYCGFASFCNCVWLHVQSTKSCICWNCWGSRIGLVVKKTFIKVSFSSEYGWKHWCCYGNLLRDRLSSSW